jgi:hypothetical protein
MDKQNRFKLKIEIDKLIDDELYIVEYLVNDLMMDKDNTNKIYYPERANQGLYTGKYLKENYVQMVADAIAGLHKDNRPYKRAFAGKLYITKSNIIDKLEVHFSE